MPISAVPERYTFSLRVLVNSIGTAGRVLPLSDMPLMTGLALSITGVLAASRLRGCGGCGLGGA